MDETRRSDVGDESGGRYKFGSIYFEESRIRCKYMLCDGDAPGACMPEEVLAAFTDAFGLGLPSMCFRGLGANGWWESGFSTLDFQAQLDSVAGQVRSRSSQEESDQRLMSLSDERARAALAAWGTLTMLDKNIVDNKVVTAASNEDGGRKSDGHPAADDVGGATDAASPAGDDGRRQDHEEVRV